MSGKELDLGPIEERVTAYNGQPYMNPDYIRLCNNAHVDLVALVAEVKRLRKNNEYLLGLLIEVAVHGIGEYVIQLKLKELGIKWQDYYGE
jgi:hypothetical protein